MECSDADRGNLQTFFGSLSFFSANAACVRDRRYLLCGLSNQNPPAGTGVAQARHALTIGSQTPTAVAQQKADDSAVSQSGIPLLIRSFKRLRASWILDGYGWIQVFLNLFIELRPARIHLFILPCAMRLRLGGNHVNANT
jgi:hypothetical protein